MISGHDLYGLDEHEQGRLVFERLLEEVWAPLGYCVLNRHDSSAQLLMYAAIDIFANLVRDPGKEQVTREDYRRWVKAYMLAGGGTSLPCNECDLYAARCGMLHALNTESRDSRQNNARMIFLVHKPASIREVQETLDRADLNGQRGVAVYFDELLAAFRGAVDRFRGHLESDPELAKLAYSRARKIPVYLPASMYRPKGPED